MSIGQHLTAYCNVTRNPTAGEEGIITIASNVPCTEPWPADTATKTRWSLATTFTGYEMFANADEDVKQGHTVHHNGTTYTIVKPPQIWPSHGRHPGIMALLLSKRIS